MLPLLLLVLTVSAVSDVPAEAVDPQRYANQCTIASGQSIQDALDAASAAAMHGSFSCALLAGVHFVRA